MIANRSTLVVLPVTTLDQEQEFCELAPKLVPQQLVQSHADLHLMVYAGGQAVARCSLWWNAVPYLQGQRVGCIGHYAALDRAGAAELLRAACAKLAAQRCTIALGPLNGSTFRAYRFVTKRSFQGEAHPAFLLEPDNPDAWPEDFRWAGFAPWSEYISARAPLLGADPTLQRLTATLAEKGVELRGLAPAIFDPVSGPEAFERELARIYPLVMTAFAANPLFTPITYEEFAAQYAPVRSLLTPDLVVLAEREGELVGFLMAIPNFAQAQRGEAIDTVILKTLAVLPRLAGIGLGSLLAASVHTRAHALGYPWAIHALMHVDNRSRRISAHTAQPFRGYSLFARSLT